MLIEIQGVGEEKLFRPLALIAELFFEDVDISFTKTKHADFTVLLDVKIDNEIVVKASILERDVTISHQVTLPKSGQAREIRNAHLHAFLALLEKDTGIKQKWGILTGVRPTKLMHKKLQSGLSRDAIYKEFTEKLRLAPEKITLMEKIAERQLAVLPDLYDLKKEVSIYIGIPFCPTKCAYCTFPAYAIRPYESLVDGFLSGLLEEIKGIGLLLQEKQIPITTIYFGGGTPTSITAEEMDRLYEHMYRYFPSVKTVREVTVEAGRPDTITPEKLHVLKKWDIDRISVNPQTYHQPTLKAIGRHHTVKDTIEKFHLSRAMGMNNINMDIILGLPGENIEILQHTLQETEKLQPESLTVHTLSFKRASAMTQNKEKYKVASREEVAQMMTASEAWAKEYDYVPYYLYRQKNILGNLENVGYAKVGQESLYNILIMEEVQTIIGIGCGATSKFIDPKTGKIERYANPKDPHTYNQHFEKYLEEKIEKLKELY